MSTLDDICDWRQRPIGRADGKRGLSGAARGHAWPAHNEQLDSPAWDEVYVRHFIVDIEGWHVTLHNDCDTLDYSEKALCPDGRRWAFDPGDRYGTDPVALLSTWENQTLERTLKAL